MTQAQTAQIAAVRDAQRLLTASHQGARAPEGDPTMPTHQTTDADRAVVSKHLLEALGKEQQLVTALQAQIAVAQRPGLRHALEDHLAVTQRQVATIELRLGELGHRVGQEPEGVAHFGEQSSLGRPGQPAEIAAVYVHLALPESSYTTGEVYGVTGGNPVA